ncbi:hypothetical protein FRB94_003768 [Tulasnella sp. JGI-2019a]|nr:hypothetical protein FRB94_003768 [Tulasnella sp. JGI-2019a]
MSQATQDRTTLEGQNPGYFVCCICGEALHTIWDWRGHLVSAHAAHSIRQSESVSTFTDDPRYPNLRPRSALWGRKPSPSKHQPTVRMASWPSPIQENRGRVSLDERSFPPLPTASPNHRSPHSFQGSLRFDTGNDGEGPQRVREPFKGLSTVEQDQNILGVSGTAFLPASRCPTRGPTLEDKNISPMTTPFGTPSSSHFRLEALSPSNRTTVLESYALESEVDAARRRAMESRASTISESDSGFQEHISSSSSGTGTTETRRGSNRSKKKPQDAWRIVVSATVRSLQIPGLSSRQRKLKLLVKTLKSGTSTSCLQAVTRLQALANETWRGRREVAHCLMRGSPQERRKTLESIFAVAETETRDDDILSRDNPVSSMAELIMREKFAKALEPMVAYLNDPLVMGGAAGVYTFAENFTGTQRTQKLDRALLTFAKRILNSEPRHGLVSRSGHQAFRLLDLLVRSNPHLPGFQSWDHIPLRVSLRQDSAATKSAVLQLIRSSSGILPIDLVGSLIPSVLHMVTSRAEAHQVRCLGFAALTALLHREMDQLPELEVLMQLCCSVLLRGTNWQSYHKSMKSRWIVPRLPPPDQDAYSIISLRQCIDSPHMLVPAFQREMMSLGIGVAEPLRALIVRHSADNKNSSIFLISLFIQAGILPVLIRIATLPLPRDEHRNFRYITRARCTALISLNSCFEQMLARDFKHIEPYMVETLLGLASDDTLPMTVQEQAAVALHTWTHNFREPKEDVVEEPLEMTEGPEGPVLGPLPEISTSSNDTEDKSRDSGEEETGLAFGLTVSPPPEEATEVPAIELD